jgi:hypothetical protein
MTPADTRVAFATEEDLLSELETPAAAQAPAWPAAKPWSRAARLFFRFGCIYLFFYIVDIVGSYSHPPEMIRPGVKWATEHFQKAIAFPQLAGTMIGTPCAAERLPWCWLYFVAWQALLAAAVAALWTAIRWRRLHYNGLHGTLRVTLRYLLALVAWNYAVAKFKGVQFWVRAPSLLVTPLGDWGRMDLMWSTMGLSVVFGMFTGVGEAVAALLLLWRRTVTIGAIVAAGIMGVIAVMDLAHHAGTVGRTAFNSMIAAVFLMAPDIRRLADVYLFNRAAPAVAAERRLIRGRVGAALKFAAVLYVLVLPYRRTPDTFSPFWFPRHPMSGLYRVESHTLDGVALPIDDERRWVYVDLSGRNGTFGGTPEMPEAFAAIRENAWSAFGMRVEQDKQTLNLKTGRGKEEKTVGTLRFERLGNGLRLDGTVNGAAVQVSLRQLPLGESVIYGGSGYRHATEGQ